MRQCRPCVSYAITIAQSVPTFSSERFGLSLHNVLYRESASDFLSLFGDQPKNDKFFPFLGIKFPVEPSAAPADRPCAILKKKGGKSFSGVTPSVHEGYAPCFHHDLAVLSPELQGHAAFFSSV